MKNIIDRFLIKIQKDKSNLNLFYLYNGAGINSELTFSEQANKSDKQRKKMNILIPSTEEDDIIKSFTFKDIICPKCKENILIDIKNFKISLYHCKNKHNINYLSISQFEETQEVDLSKIRCETCKRFNKGNTHNNNFFICNTCNQNLCPLCKSKHDPNHSIINYDDKYYICKNHNDPFTKYCKNCIENICIMCENQHKEHDIFELGKILIDKNDLLKVFENLKNVFNTFKSKIKEKEILDKIENKINYYYKINNDLINNYNMNKRNYHKLRNLNHLKMNNEKMIKELNALINKDNIFDIYDFLYVNFYNCDDNYIGEIKNGLKDGKGIFYFKKDDEQKRKKYKGEFKSGKMEGKGIMYYINGDRYEGDFINNYREGKGIIYYKNGDNYEVVFKNDKEEEKGITHYINRLGEEYINSITPEKEIIYYKKGEIKEYDVIILGTGLKEMLLADLFSKFPEQLPGKDKKDGTKILILDRNDFLGSDSSSFSLTNLWKYFRPKETVPKYYGKEDDWKVDLILKTIMPIDSLAKLLMKIDISANLKWKSFDGSFIYQFNAGGFFKKAKAEIIKVPYSMGSKEKTKYNKFISFIEKYDAKDPDTQNHLGPNVPFKEVLNEFNLEAHTIDLIGNAMALYINDDYLNKKASLTIDRLKLYMNSFEIGEYYAFIYPMQGLGEIIEASKSFCISKGGICELNREVEKIFYDEEGKFVGIQSDGEEYYGKILITEPSYVRKLGMVKSCGKVIRRICILDHTIPNSKDVDSCLIVIPQKEINRKNAIFIVALNSTLSVCKKGYYLVIVTTVIETDRPETEIEPAMNIIGPTLEYFDIISDIYQPVDTNFKDNVFITSSIEPEPSFENDMDNIIDIYEKITGKKLDFNLEKEGKNNLKINCYW